MMVRSEKGRLLFLIVGVLCLISSAIMWWALARGGITAVGAIQPALFTLMGFFWLFVSHKAKGGE